MNSKKKFILIIFIAVIIALILEVAVLKVIMNTPLGVTRGTIVSSPNAQGPSVVIKVAGGYIVVNIDSYKNTLPIGKEVDIIKYVGSYRLK